MSNDLAYLYEDDTEVTTLMEQTTRFEFLAKVEELGVPEVAAAEIGYTPQQLSDVVAADDTLAQEILVAKGKHRAMVIRRMTDLAFRGSEKAIVGGKNKDEILGADVIPNDKAMELLAKMQFSDELALVTRQKITAKVDATASKDPELDFSQLDRKDRKELDTILRKAKKLVDVSPK